MAKRALWIIIRLVAGLVAGAVVLVALAAWRLSLGPVSLSYVTPFIAQVLNGSQHRDFRFTLADTVVSWGGWRQPFDVRVLDVRVRTPDGKTIAQVPEVSLALSSEALWRGIVAPESVELLGPKIRVIRRASGGVDLNFADIAATPDVTRHMVSSVFSDIMSPPDAARPMSYLTHLGVVGARIDIEDERTSLVWNASSSDVDIRRDAKGLRGEATLNLDGPRGKSDISLIGTYDRQSGRIEMGGSFAGVNPSAYAELSKRTGILAALDVPLAGTLTASLTPDGTVESVGFDTTGGAGHLAVPVAAAQHMGMLSLAQRVAIAGLHVKGRYDGQSGDGAIDAFRVDFAKGARVYVPAPVAQEFPIATLTAQGRYDAHRRRVEVTAMKADLMGPQARLSGVVQANGAQEAPWRTLSIDAKVGFGGVGVKPLMAYWPSSLVPDVRNWVQEHIQGGRLDDLGADMRLRTRGADVHLDSLHGTLSAENLSIDILPPLPVLHDGHARATFDDKRFDIQIQQAHSHGLSANSGRVVFTKLTDPIPHAEVDVPISGPLRNVLEFIDSEPLGFAQGLGLEPGRTAGQADIRLKMDFPLKKDLDFKEISVSATAHLEGAALKSVFLGQDLTGGRFDIKVDRKGLDMAGGGRIGDVPIDVSWRENFNTDALFRSQFNIRAGALGVAQVRALSGGTSPLFTRILRDGNVLGTFSGDAALTILKDGRKRVRADLNLKPLSFSIPELGWRKAAGVAAAAAVDIKLDGSDAIRDIPKFSVTSDRLDLEGAVRFARRSGAVDTITLNKIRAGRTDLSGTVRALDKGAWAIAVQGGALDFGPMWAHFGQAESSKQAGKGDGEPLPNYTLDAKISKVWLDDSHAIHDVNGLFVRADGIWKRLDVSATIAKGEVFTARVARRGAGRRHLTMHSDDAGAVLRLLDYYPNMVGGILTVDGVFDDRGDTSSLSGTVNVKKYQIIKAPVLARLLSLMALGGIVDALNGEGIGFAGLNVPFTYDRGVVRFKNAEASGTSIGLTMDGWYDRTLGTLDMKGTIVPIYALNSVLGKIPFLGTLLTGTEKGGGMFAATYRVKGTADKAEITVNPLSVLTPGILRNIFGALLGDSTAPAPQGETPKLKDRKSGMKTTPPPVSPQRAPSAALPAQE